MTPSMLVLLFSFWMPADGVKREAKDERIGPDLNVRVIYIGGGDTDPEFPEPLTVGLSPSGALSGDKGFDVKDSDLKKWIENWIETYAKGKKHVAIELAMSDPSKTTFKSVTDVVLRLRKVVPKEVKVVIFIRDDD